MKDIQLKLLQRPRILRDTYDTLREVEHHYSVLGRNESGVNPLYRYSESKEKGCNCQRRTRSHGIVQHENFGKSFWAISLTSERKNHLNDNCSHCAWQVSSWVVRCRLAYCGRLLAGALQASFACTTGAGGASFTPSLIFRNVVTHDSPAFAIINKAEYGYFKYSIEEQIHDLRQVFQERRASPYDIDVYGNTLLHVSKLATFSENKTPWNCRIN